MKRARRLAQLERLREIRLALAKKSVKSDSVAVLRKMREERTDRLTGRD